jgi:hypothetical protein
MAQDLGQLIDQITVDAYGLDEQLMGFLQVFLDEVTLPVSGVVLSSSGGFDPGLLSGLLFCFMLHHRSANWWAHAPSRQSGRPRQIRSGNCTEARRGSVELTFERTSMGSLRLSLSRLPTRDGLIIQFLCQGCDRSGLTFSHHRAFDMFPTSMLCGS